MGELELIEKKYQVIWRVCAKEANRHLLGWKMLENNEILGFLPFDYYYVDNEIQFRYGYSAYQRMEEYFKGRNGDFETISFLCEAVLKILERGQEYLLNLDGCLLLPEWIFWNRQEKRVGICFLPGREGDVRKDFITLVEYFMQCTDHNDKMLVSMIYGFYDRLVSTQFLPGQLLQYLQEFLDQRPAVSKLCKEMSRAEGKQTLKGGMHKERKYCTEKTFKNAGKGCFLEVVREAEGGKLVDCLLQGRSKKVYSVGIGEFVVGREEKSDLYIPFGEISRRHALLISEAQGLYIMDTASKNGTYLNGNKISAYVKTFCKENDVITFADISYKIKGTEGEYIDQNKV